MEEKKSISHQCVAQLAFYPHMDLSTLLFAESINYVQASGQGSLSNLPQFPPLSHSVSSLTTYYSVGLPTREIIKKVVKGLISSYALILRPRNFKLASLPLSPGCSTSLLDFYTEKS